MHYLKPVNLGSVYFLFYSFRQVLLKDLAPTLRISSKIFARSYEVL